MVKNTGQYEQDHGTFSFMASTRPSKTKTTTLKGGSSYLNTSYHEQKNQSYVYSISNKLRHLLQHFSQEAPTCFVHHKGCSLRIKCKPYHIRLLAFAILGYTLIASALLYYYLLGNICDERNCITTSDHHDRSINTMNTVLKKGRRDVNVSGGKETYVFHGKSESPGIKPSMRKKDDKHSVDKVLFHQDKKLGVGHVEKSKQKLLKGLGKPVEKVAVANIKAKDTQIQRIGIGLNTNTLKRQCKGDSVRIPLTRQPRGALASSPGSGNTWTRHLLQQATGIATGSIYGDGQLQQKGFPGEIKCVKTDTCLIVKTHEWKMSYQTYYQRAILILRHPRESVVSSFHYFNGGLHLKEANPKLFQSDHWFRFAEERIRFWHELNHDWVTKFRNPLHIIFYEELKATPIIQIEQAVRFLNFTMTETDKTCMKKNLEGNFQRKHSNVIDLNTLYNGTLLTLMNKRVQNLTTAIRNRFPNKHIPWT